MKFLLIPCALLLAAGMMGTATGCKKQDPNQAAANEAQDPAAANLADASNDAAQQAASASPAATPAPAASSAPATSYAPAQSAPATQASYAPEQLEAAETPAYTAYAAPPELPQYEQPYCPGEGYIWTPGYWSYHPTGYYWVPGVWVRAPYEGALWTPGYWAFRGGRYLFYRGHWGRHMGYYGGINYGYGYVGTGYEGGYWHGPAFQYNRAVNNINTTVVHNVYNYRVTNVTNVTRVSFNGERGVMARPRPQEFAEYREPRALPMHTQMEHEQMAQRDRAQFFQGQGRPGRVVAERGLEADREVHPAPHGQLPAFNPKMRQEPLRPMAGPVQHGEPGGGRMQHGPVAAPVRQQPGMNQREPGGGQMHPGPVSARPEQRKPGEPGHHDGRPEPRY